VWPCEGGLPALGASAATFSASQSLTALLTTESLLFAAFNVGVGLSAPIAAGRNISRRGVFLLAVFALVALGLVASAGVLAWWQVFIDHWPASSLRRLEAVGIFVGLIVQPLFTAVVARSLKP
jgi:hypothetical protein